MVLNYSLDEYSLKLAMTHQICLGHFKKALGGEGFAFGHRFVHFCIALIELPPVIGTIAQIFEVAIHPLWKRNSTENSILPNSKKAVIKNLNSEQLELLKNTLTDDEAVTSQLNKEELYVIKLFNLKVLEFPGDAPVNYKHKLVENGAPARMEGLRATSAMCSYKQDLINYKSSLDPSSSSINKIESAIELLSSAIEFKKLQICKEFFMERFSLDDASYDFEVKKRMRCKIENLQVGERFILGGGYTSLSSVHIVIYEIVKTSQETFDFKIVNTGESAMQTWGDFCSNIGRSICQRRLIVRETVYKDAKFADLDMDSFFPLLMVQEYKKKTSPWRGIMSGVNKEFRTYFQNQHQCRPSPGRLIKAQTRGSCAAKSVSAWLRGYLGKEDHRPFKIFVTQQEIKNIQTLRRKPDVDGRLGNLDYLEKRGDQALQRRRRKSVAC